MTKLLTIYMGPDDVAATLELKFNPGITAVQLRHSVRNIELAIRDRFPSIKRVYYEAASLTGEDGDGHEKSSEARSSGKDA